MKITLLVLGGLFTAVGVVTMIMGVADGGSDIELFNPGATTAVAGAIFVLGGVLAGRLAAKPSVTQDAPVPQQGAPAQPQVQQPQVQRTPAPQQGQAYPAPQQQGQQYAAQQQGQQYAAQQQGQHYPPQPPQQ